MTGYIYQKYLFWTFELRIFPIKKKFKIVSQADSFKKYINKLG